MNVKKRIVITIAALAAAAAAIVAISYKEKTKWQGLTLRVAGPEALSVGSYAEGAALFAEKYGCNVEFTQDYENCDLFYSSGEDFSFCMPLDNYVNPKNSLYTEEIIRQSCTADGNIYGITNVLMGNINYCTYTPSQLGNTASPYDYYKKNSWTWDNFIKMADDIGGNVAVDWRESYINMRHALYLSEDGEPRFDYGTQEQVEWLNFIRTLIYDEGIVENGEGAFKVDFLPGLILNSPENDEQLRYIPWPTKTGRSEALFVDEYHFCVPKVAQTPKASVALANYMIKSCCETRAALYKASMTEEDYKIFEKRIKSVYSYPRHEDYVPAERFIDDFIHGKTVTEHIYNVENDATHIE